jgi:hypothetical protein
VFHHEIRLDYVMSKRAIEEELIMMQQQLEEVQELELEYP